MRYQGIALEALQESAEAYLVGIFEDTKYAFLYFDVSDQLLNLFKFSDVWRFETVSIRVLR